MNCEKNIHNFNNNNILLEKKILNICNCDYNFFLNKSNIIGIGLGYKITNGVYTKNKCLKVFTKIKLDYNKLNSKDLIPKFYKGIPTDVCESGIFYSSKLTNKIRPVTGGYSIGPTIGSTGGSMGCLVSDRFFQYILSGNHVIASEGKTPLGTPILQPAPIDGGIQSTDLIGNLSKYIPLKPINKGVKPENFVDCAIAKVFDKSLVSSKITLIGNIHGTHHSFLGQDVQKCGRSTELTTGKIDSIGTSIIVPYDTGDYLFKNQITTTSMSSKGDSGSLLLDIKNNVVGLLLGDSLSQSLFNPIDVVLKNLNVKIVT